MALKNLHFHIKSEKSRNMTMERRVTKISGSMTSTLYPWDI